MSLAAVSGDIGGARAILPVLEYMYNHHQNFEIVDHGVLAKLAPAEWPRISMSETAKDRLELLFSKKFKALIFTTSVKDAFTLKLARAASSQGIPVLCLLDNWMNYMHRLKIDGEPALIPDVYMVMDDLAKAEAIGEGVPESILRVVGQPALGSLAGEYQRWKKQDRAKYFGSADLDITKKLIVFISEPVSNDQGSGPENSQYRGYTEKTVLKQFCAELQPFAASCQLCIAPHPRDDIAELNILWERCRGKMTGGLLQLKSGRQAIFLADGVAGMASILLYEAWLMSRPVISLQPGLHKPQLAFMQKREGAICVTDARQWQERVSAWMKELTNNNLTDRFRDELSLHISAAANVAGVIKEYMN
jgi:hypothetical protein